jgi:hypothetical protein
MSHIKMVNFLIYSTNYLMAEDSNVVRKLIEEGVKT